MNGTASETATGHARVSGSGHAAVHVSRYLSRPGRRVLVIDDLADLRGPVSGTVELPIWLFWYPNRVFSLDEPGVLRWVCQIVLREASRPEDLARYLNREALIGMWQELHLPSGIRQAWEERHPALRTLVDA
jgi:hypothetical protein